MRLHKFLLAAVGAAAFAMPMTASADIVTFDFRTTNGSGVVDGNGAAPSAGGDFDSSDTAGGTSTLGVTLPNPDGLGPLTLTIVDILAPEYDATFALTGNTLSAAAGAAITTNISGQDALGINNPSINNSGFDNIGGGNESSDINTGESIVFSFDQDVIFTEIELESIVASDEFDVSVDGVAVLETTGDDEFIDDLGGLAGLQIAAGSEITFAAGGPVETSSFRIETFSVQIVPVVAAVPEPGSMLAIAGVAGLFVARRRRR